MNSLTLILRDVFAGIGIAACVLGLWYCVSKLLDHFVIEKLRRRWRRNKEYKLRCEQAAQWLGRWGA